MNENKLDKIDKLIKIKKVDEAQLELSKLGPEFHKNVDYLYLRGQIFLINKLYYMALDTLLIATEFEEKDKVYDLIAKIDPDKCIGCGLCYVACLDGAHQCIHTQKGPCHAFHGESDHGVNPRTEVKPAVLHEAEDASLDYVPFVDEPECIGCNLCQIVCPVSDCITMEEVPHSLGKESWK